MEDSSDNQSLLRTQGRARQDHEEEKIYGTIKTKSCFDQKKISKKQNKNRENTRKNKII